MNPVSSPVTLTRKQRAELRAGHAPRISGSERICPVEEGHVIHLGKDFRLEVTQIRVVKGGGWSLGYTVHDNRDPARLVRRTPPMHTDDPRQDTDADAIRKAGDESAYTSSPHAAVTDAGEAVPDAWQKAQTKQAREYEQRALARRRKDQALLKQEDRILQLQREAAIKRIDIRSESRMLAKLLAQGKPAEGQVKAIARKIDQHTDRRAA